MRKFTIMVLAIFLAAATAAAVHAAEKAETAGQEAVFEADVSAGVWSVRTEKNPSLAGEYDYLHNSGAGAVDLEWDPLPHRFVLESLYLNSKDYFADMDYAWKDIVVFNFLTRGLFHNLGHLDLGEDDAATALPSFTDLDPSDTYGVQQRISRSFLRLKMPDFPFHIYAEARQTDRKGTSQQRFMNEYLGGAAKVSESRYLETKGLELTTGANSHLGPVELDYSHTEKKIEAFGDKLLKDPYPAGANEFSHNLVPDIDSSSDTVKLHTSYTGRLVAAATYTSGDKKNKDSSAKADYWIAAGDVTFIPINDLALYLKYRRYDLELTNPDTVTVTGLLAPATYSVRDSISSERDVVTGSARYRVTDRLSVKAEYIADSYKRDVGLLGLNVTPPPANTAASWSVARETTKGTARIGATYRVMNALSVRADYSRLSVGNPAYDTDPDSADTARATATWNPYRKTTVVLGYVGVREDRDNLDPPLAGGERKTSRDQAFGSVTVLTGKRSSVTASYGYFKNKVDQTVTYRDATGADALEGGVPYADTAETGSLFFTHSPANDVILTAGAARTFSKGSFRNSGLVADTGGLAELSDLKLVESEYSAGLELEQSKTTSFEFRYRLMETDDKLDNTLDGTVQLLLATMSVKW